MSGGGSAPGAAKPAAKSADKLSADIYGFVMADTIYDFKRVDPDWADPLRITTIPTQGGLEDVVKATQLAGKSTWEPFYFAIVCGLIYLVFTTVSNGVLLFLERRYSVGVKRADL